ncbi:MAG TPA: amino acid adenylation domain-containing protein [Gaiellaceae bacterium]
MTDPSLERRAAAEERLLRRRGRNAHTIPRRAGGPLPLSFAQERIWLLDQLYPGTTAYNVTRVLRVPGRLHAGALAHALRSLVERHEILRTVVSGEASGPRTRVLEEFAVQLDVVDLESDRPVDVEARADEAVRRFAGRPFDLARDVLLRALLVRLPSDETLLALATHHIASDEGSRSILVEETDRLYRAHLRGDADPLDPLPIQYGDYAAWQREHVTGQTVEAGLRYWRDQLETSVSEVDLPTDRTRPARSTFRGARAARLLPRELLDSVKALSADEAVTPFTTLLAAFVALLHRYSGQDDIAVGIPVTSRNRPELDGLIGVFLNNLVLRVQLAPDCTFSELVATVKEVAVAAYAHQDVPFERVVEELQPDRDLSRSPLFNVTFGLEASSTDETSFGGMPARVHGVDVGSTKYDLSLDMAERSDGLQAVLEYSRDLFDDSTAIRLLRHLETLLASAVAEPRTRVSELGLLPDDELAALVAHGNDIGTAYPERCVHELIAAGVHRFGDRVAVSGPNGELTYSELEEQSNRLARRLRALGVGRDVLVGICLERRVELLVAVLATWKAGGAYVPLDPAYPRERLAEMLADARAPVLVTESALVELLPSREASLVVVDTDDGRAADESTAPLDLAGHDPDQLAYVIYTSGSTGPPKGVEIPHRALVNFLFSMLERPGFGPDDVLLAVTTFSFDIAGLELYLPLLAGGRTVLCPTGTQQDPRALAALLETSGATVMQATPTTWRLLVEDGWRGAGGLRGLCGGEGVPQALADELLAQGAEVWIMYGPTETTIWSTCGRLDAGDRVTLGNPLRNTTLYVLNEGLSVQPAGVAGELYIGGHGLARGYRNRPELTAERFVPDPFSDDPGARLYRTGDRVRRLSDGSLEFLGRLDNQVKVRGFRVELGEIEARLARHPDVAECVCVVREDRPGDASLVAYVRPRRDRVSVQELRSHLAAHVPAYMVPSTFVSVPRFPLTPNGKIDRRRLPAPGPEKVEEREYVAPRTGTEQVLAMLFAETLGVERIGLRDDFFVLGGHSLLAARVAAAVRRELRTDVPMAAVFEYPTVEGLARVVESAGSDGAPAAIPRAPRAGPVRASFAQHRVWYLDRLEREAPMYNIPLALGMRGAVDAGALERALNRLVDRHEGLRSRFVEMDGEPFVEIVDDAAIELDRLNAPSRDDALDAVVAAARRPFDLSRAPLVRAALVRVAAVDESILGITFHHAVADGWSLRIARRELEALYARECARDAADLPELTLQYVDFAAWQRARNAGQALDVQRAYWRGRLEGAPDLLDLPTDRPRPPLQSYRGAKHVATLSREVHAETVALARAHGVTPFVVLLAAFKTVLARHSGQSDIVVGTPIAGRSHADLEGLIGFFANTLVLRSSLEGEPTFSALIRRVRETAVGAYANQDVPFEELVVELAPARSLSYSPLFQVMFIMQHAEEPGVESSAFEPVATDAGTSRFDLTLSVTERPEGLRMSFEYSTDLFEHATVERLAGHLETLLRAAAADPEQPITRLPLLTEPERAGLLTVSTGPVAEVPSGATVVDLFESRVQAHPDQVAVICGGRTLTYGDLDERANRLAGALRGAGVGPGRLVGLWAERRLELIVGLMGILKAGGAYVPLEPTYPEERLAFMLGDADIDVLVAPDECVPVLSDGLRVVPVDQAAVGAVPTPGERAAGPAGDDLAYVIYTSGSTGRPKGVEITHRSLVNLLQSMAKRPGLAPGEVMAAITTPAFDLSVPDLFLPLVCGATMVLVPTEGAADAAHLAELLSNHGVNAMQATPTTWRMLLEVGWHGGERFRAICGGEAVPADLVADLRERVGSIWHMYGPTEATVWSTTQEVAEDGTLSLHPPIDNTAVYVLDGNLELVPFGVAGELCIGGIGLARGYRGRQGLSRRRFVSDPFAATDGARLYLTGDLARRRSDGVVEFLGRGDHQVKLRGFRIELGEIEAVLGRHPRVKGAVVAMREDAVGDPRLVAYAVPDESGSLDSIELKRHVGRSLPSYMVPADVVFLRSLPLTPNGKVDRSALPEWEGLSRDDRFVPPRTPIEEDIARIYAELLGVDRVGVTDDFFALGGHSFRATQLVSRIRDSLKVELPLIAVYETPTVGGLAETLALRLLQGEHALAALEAIEGETEAHDAVV